eukprot:scaffold23382_cov36-Tisochrysis_lutea.AAC.3
MRPRPAFRTWLPYKKDCSADGFTQTLASKGHRSLGHKARAHAQSPWPPREPSSAKRPVIARNREARRTLHPHLVHSHP